MGRRTSALAHYWRRVLVAMVTGRYGLPLALGLVAGLALHLATLPLMDRGCGGPSFTVGGGEEGDYEPRLVARDPDEIAQKLAAQKKVVRPRYYSTELDIKEKLLVAVLTRPQLLHGFGVALNQTLHHHVDKLIFFVHGATPPPVTSSTAGGVALPVVALQEDSAHPVMVLEVLRYLHAHHSGSYDYFLLVHALDRHSLPYVNGRALQRALSHVSVGRPLHLGLPAAQGAHYCSLDGGVVLSGAVVAGVAHSASWCDEHATSDRRGGEDAILGRCILHATALPCTHSTQEQEYRSVSLAEALDGAPSPSPATLHAALDRHVSPTHPALPFTVTHLRQPHQLHATHQYFLAREVSVLRRALQKKRRVILAARDKAPLLPHEDTWPLGSPAPHTPATRYDVLPWVTFNASHVLMPDDHRNTAPLAGALLQDITSVVLAGASHITNTSAGRLQLQRLNYGHYRVDPVRGTDYLLSLVFRDTDTGSLVDKIVEAARSITQAELVPMPYVTENPEVTLLVPVSVNHITQATSFIERFLGDKAVSSNTVLLLVLLQPTQRQRTDPFKSVREVCGSVTGERPVRCLSAVEAPPNSPTPELHVVDQVVRRVVGGSLVLVVPPAASLTSEVLNRVRMNTILGGQFFSPVMYGLFHPAVVPDRDSKAYANKEVKSTLGHYLRYDYSAISFYMADYKKARKLSGNLFPIVSSAGKQPGWTKQPKKHHLSLYRLLLSFSSLHALRAPEPFLRLPYEAASCPGDDHKRSTNTAAAASSMPSYAANLNKAPSHPPNELSSDVSLLMGDSEVANNAAFYNYVRGHFLLDQGRTLNWTLDDFTGDGYCHEKLLHSFGTRVQLSKLVIDYDDKHGRL